MATEDTLSAEPTDVQRLLECHQLQETIDSQVQQVKDDPVDQGKRLFLFELLCFAGEWDRAKRQLAAVRYDDPERDLTVATYRRLVDAQQARHEILRGSRRPEFLGTPSEHAHVRLEALDALLQGRQAEAADLLRGVDANGPAVQGQLNGARFELLRDCDDLFGTTLEAISLSGQYYWIPLEHVAAMEVSPPEQLRDLLWLPARLEIRGGPDGHVFLPTLYPGSHEHHDDRVRLGRMTDWVAEPDGPVRGQGLRTFLIDEEAVTLPEWRTLVVD